MEFTPVRKDELPAVDLNFVYNRAFVQTNSMTVGLFGIATLQFTAVSASCGIC